MFNNKTHFGFKPRDPLVSIFRAYGGALQKIVVLGMVATCASAQMPESPVVRDPLAVQHARTTSVTSKGAKVFYAPRWDLSALPHYVPEQKVSGTIRMWGSNYMGDGKLAKYWEEGFRKYHPDVKFDYHLLSAWIAIGALDTGVADIAPCRKITFSELEGFQRVFEHDPLEIRMVTGSYNVPGWNPAFMIIVNKNNPLTKLTMKQLDGIFGAARTGGWVGTEWHPEFARGKEENIRTWGQVGLSGEWKDKPINTYGLNLRYHQATEISDWILKGSDKWNEDLRVYANFAKANGTIDRSLLPDLIADPNGIAYAAAWIEDMPPELKALPIAAQDGGPYIPLTIDTVHDQTYPLSDAAYLYVNRIPGKAIDPKVREYLRYVLSQEGQDAVQRDGKYLPLTEELVKEELKKLN